MARRASSMKSEDFKPKIKVSHHQVTENTWYEAAAQITTDIHCKRLLRNQLVSIDAHESTDGKCHFSVFYTGDSRTENQKEKESGHVELRYLEKEGDIGSEEGGWASFYDFAVRGCTGFSAEQIVSITCSRSGKENKGVCYVFYDASVSPDPGYQTIMELHWVETRGATWDDAAEQIRGLLRLQPVGSSQIVSITTHQADDEANERTPGVFVAFWAEALSVQSPLLGWIAQRGTDSGLKELYAGAARDGEMLGHYGAGSLMSVSSVACKDTGELSVYTIFVEDKQVVCTPPPPPAAGEGLRILSLNTLDCASGHWGSAGNRFSRLVDVMKFAMPDVALLQEFSNTARARQLAIMLGLYYDCYSPSGLVVVSRYPMERICKGTHHLGVRIRLDPNNGNRNLFCVSVRLPNEPYAPYELHEKNATPASAAALEARTQLKALRPVLSEIKKHCQENESCILAGSFAAASSLDYEDSYEGQMRWPCSDACVEAGLTDTYLVPEANEANKGHWKKRVPDARGVTWTTNMKLEPQTRFERIDYIYSGAGGGGVGLETVESIHLDTATTALEWPCAHKAVLSIMKEPTMEPA